MASFNQKSQPPIEGRLEAVNPVVVIGTGMRTVIGAGTEAACAAIRARISYFTEHPFEDYIIAKADYLISEFDCGERMLELAVPAAEEAICCIENVNEKFKTRFIIGLPLPRPGLEKTLEFRPEIYKEAKPAVKPDPESKIEERLKKAIRERFAAQYKITEIETISAGHVAGFSALEKGIAVLNDSKADFCVIGGVDSYIGAETLEWLSSTGRLNSEENPWGFFPGEGAGFVVITLKNTAKNNGLKILGTVLGVSTARENNLIGTDSVCTGEGLTAAFRGALNYLPDRNAKIDQILSDVNNEPYRADEFGFMFVRASQHLKEGLKPVFPAKNWGDVGAASGPMSLCLAVALSIKGYSDGPVALITAGSEGGERAAVLLQTIVNKRD